MANFDILQAIQPGKIVATLPSAGGGDGGGDGIGDIMSGISGLIGGISGAASGNPTPSTPTPSTQFTNPRTYGANYTAPTQQQSIANQSLTNNISPAFQNQNRTIAAGVNDPFKIAMQQQGLKEGNPVLTEFLRKSNPNLDPRQTPWCAGYVGSVLNASGMKGTNSLMARSYLNWGNPVKSPSVGDIVVLDTARDGVHGHVGFYAGQDPKGGIKVLGGNQDNSVSIKTFNPNLVLGYRQPPNGAQIGQTAQKMGIQNPSQLVRAPNQLTTSRVAQSQQAATANPMLDSTMAGIAHVESQGAQNPYTLMSKPTRGDRAYGKYQIMGKNIPAWTKEATGTAYTPQEFMANPNIQEQTARYQIQKNLEKYGNPDDAYSVWFSGRPASKAGNARDAYGTSVPQYIRKAREGAQMYDGNRNTVGPMTAITPNEAPVTPYTPGDSMGGHTTPLFKQWYEANPYGGGVSNVPAPTAPAPIKLADAGGPNWELLQALMANQEVA